MGAICSNSSNNYYLEITINNETQTQRRLLKSFDYLRKDTNDVIKKNVTIEGTALGSPLTIFGGLSVTADNNITHNNPLITVINKNNGMFSGSNLKLENNLGQFIQLGIGSSNNTLTGSKGSTGGLGYSGGTSFGFTNVGNANWTWKIVDISNFPVIIQKRLMELTSNGSLILYHGNLDVNGSINATGNIITSQNITSNYATAITGLFTNLNTTNITADDTGFFSYLGSLTNRVTKLFVQDIDFNGTISGSGNLNALNINATNITAETYLAKEAGEIKIGLTSSQFRVCKKFKVSDNACEEWCKLEITDGIITNCK